MQTRRTSLANQRFHLDEIMAHCIHDYHLLILGARRGLCAFAGKEDDMRAKVRALIISPNSNTKTDAKK